MKKAIFPVILILCLTGSAHAIFDLSLGVYGGLNAPVLQQDAKKGSGLGFKVKAAPIPFMAASLFYESRKFGDVEKTILEGTPAQTTVKADGGKVKTYGLEAMLGSPGGGIGPHFYGMVGVFNYKWTRTNFDTFSKTGYNVGVGLEIVIPAGLGVEGQAKFDFIPTSGGGSRKDALAYIGLNYHFGLGLP
jgi:hypothetical protein